MTVYIIFNNCPSDFGEPSILAVYSNKETAQRVMQHMKATYPYEHQYLEILEQKVR